jgi:hypothetical protein
LLFVLRLVETIISKNAHFDKKNRGGYDGSNFDYEKAFFISDKNLPKNDFTGPWYFS